MLPINREKQDETFSALASIKEFDLLILKGHLLIEECLTKIIYEFIFHRKFIEKIQLNFYSKVMFARSMSLSQQNNSTWTIVSNINELRNKIAHSLSSEDTKKAMEKLQNSFNEEANKQGVKQKGWEDGASLIGANRVMAYCVGFLESHLEEVKQFKKIVKIMDQYYHPNDNHLKDR
jgi:hypothetical protein